MLVGMAWGEIDFALACCGDWESVSIKLPAGKAFGPAVLRGEFALARTPMIHPPRRPFG
jgi:hypothetical protein